MNQKRNHQDGENGDAATCKGGRGLKCNIEHAHGGQRCIRAAGHEGLCRSRAVRGNGTITYSEWRSENGKFKSHYAYRTSYAPNARREDRP